jgi:hypothetical protein
MIRGFKKLHKYIIHDLDSSRSAMTQAVIALSSLTSGKRIQSTGSPCENVVKKSLH